MATKSKPMAAVDFLDELQQDQAGGKNTQPLLLNLTDIHSDPDQPRKAFDDETLERLAAAIKSDGILQPLLVRELDGKMVIIDGERRWKAAKLAGITQVPCYVRNDITENRRVFIQAMANANRESLADFELAKVIKRYLDENPGAKKKDVAKLLGKDAATITRLLNMLDDEFIQVCEKGLVESASALSHFKTLDEEAQKELLEAATSENQIITRDLIEEKRKSVPVASTVEEVLTVEEPFNSAFPENNQSDHDQQLSNSGSEDQQQTNTKATAPTEKGINGSSVKLSLKIQDFELLLPYFTDKEAEKVEIKFPRDVANGLIENLGKMPPEETKECELVIKESIQSLIDGIAH